MALGTRASWKRAASFSDDDDGGGGGGGSRRSLSDAPLETAACESERGLGYTARDFVRARARAPRKRHLAILFSSLSPLLASPGRRS